jgi:DNA-binding transcriptional MerR regulator
MQIPEKLFYTIGDVSRITGTKPHILRYWESKFKILRPARRYSGHRKYSQRDIDVISRIRHLIVERKYTLAGARKEISRQFGGRPASGPAAPAGAFPLLQDIKTEIEACLELMPMERESRSKPELVTGKVIPGELWD